MADTLHAFLFGGCYGQRDVWRAFLLVAVSIHPRKREAKANEKKLNRAKESHRDAEPAATSASVSNNRSSCQAEPPKVDIAHGEHCRQLRSRRHGTDGTTGRINDDNLLVNGTPRVADRA